MKLICTGIALGASTLAVLFACSRSHETAKMPVGVSSDERSTTTTVTAAGTEPTSAHASAGAMGGQMAAPMSYPDVVIEITTARCDHQVTCKQVGPHRRYPTPEDCVRAEGPKTQGELMSTGCANGFDAGKVRECLSFVAHESCGDRASLQSIDACKRGALCTPEKPMR